MHIKRKIFIVIQLILGILLLIFLLNDYLSNTISSNRNFQFLIDYLYYDVNTEKMLVGDLWFIVHQKSLQIMQPAIERHIAVWLWDPVFLFILQLPLVNLVLFLITFNTGIFFLIKKRVL